MVLLFFRQIIEWHDSKMHSLIHPYSRDEIPKFNINYKGLIKYARSIGKSVIDLSDKEKEKFIIGNTMEDIRKASIKLPR